MNQFSIKDIENLTGIKSHTLRIWEQRYGIPHPKRTATNIRYYDDNDLKLLLNVSMLNRQGHKISHLTKMDQAELERLALSYSESTSDTTVQVDALMTAMFNLDEPAFEKVLSSNLLKFGIEHTMTELFFPFMKRIGMLWQTGGVSPSFEHFMSNLIRQKLIVAIDSKSGSVKENPKSFILFLPETEIHELGLLFANYILKSRGHRTLYLGQNLPYTDLDSVTPQFKCEYIMTVLTTIPVKGSTQNFVENLANRFKNHKILITGFQVTAGAVIKPPSNVKLIESFGDFIRFADSVDVN
jgi:DNA-binding transcriptional MerR regulator